ncbi:MAG: DUF4381 family protein [Gammaproteobacteria bacterium]|jgi:hypothetical protein|nr:DUF4381 family protein [Gammaproteobacteria bacterium]
MNDAGSLQNLNDIVVPGPVSWWPLATGWYVLAALLIVILLILAIRQWRQWRRNRYRRQALAQLSSIRKGETGLQQLPFLLKRAAISAWPREQVASLSGPPWHRFLDETGGAERFCDGAGEILDRLSYAEAGQGGTDRGIVLDAAEYWLKHHRCKGLGGVNHA